MLRKEQKIDARDLAFGLTRAILELRHDWAWVGHARSRIMCYVNTTTPHHPRAID